MTNPFELQLGTLELDTKIVAVLDANGFKSLGDVLCVSQKELLNVKGFGESSLKALNLKLGKLLDDALAWAPRTCINCGQGARPIISNPPDFECPVCHHTWTMREERAPFRRR